MKANLLFRTVHRGADRGSVKMRVFIATMTALVLGQRLLPAQPPTITASPTNRIVWTGCNAAFSVGVSGAGPFTYQWRLNGTNLPDDILSTIAGGSFLNPFTSPVPATQAHLRGAAAVAVDSVGNLFIADHVGDFIFKVSTDGLIHRIAGGSFGGVFSGDGGPATNASLSGPLGVAVDSSGNIFIADTYNGRIREVNTNGIINTVAGGGTNYPGDGGPATSAELIPPVNGVAVDTAGNVLIATSDGRVRSLSTNGIITTVAGSATGGYAGDGGPATNAELGGPWGLALDRAGNLFISDIGNSHVRMVDTNGIISTVAGGGTNYLGDGGPATNADLFQLKGVAADAANNVLIAHFPANRIRQVNRSGIISTFAGGGTNFPGDGVPATNAFLSDPMGLAMDVNGNLFIAEYFDGSLGLVRKVTNTQGPTLALNQVTSTNAGNYQVVVTGSGGSVTSSVATLTVGNSPLILGTVRNLDSSLTISFLSPPNTACIVLSATNLSPPIAWQPLATNISGTDGNWQFTDMTAGASQTRFYSFVVP